MAVQDDAPMRWATRPRACAAPSIRSFDRGPPMGAEAVRLDAPEPSAGREGAAMLRMAAELFPICRSITGSGVRRTLEVLERHIPLEIIEVPSGTRVFDWTVP